MKLVNLAPKGSQPRFVNPEQVDAVIADETDTLVYAGQYYYRVRKRYTEVIEMLGAEIKEVNKNDDK